MGRPGAQWYVVQVQAGSERIMCAVIEGACSELVAAEGREGAFLSEVFCPRFATQRKLRGEWVRVERPLMPGYVIAETDSPDALARALRSVPDFARVLTAGGAYAPLSPEDRTWLEDSTQAGERVVPMSMAYQEGGKLVVTVGPLKGREATIVRTTRSKNLAHLELDVNGIRVKTTVGLGVLPKEKALAHRKG